MKAIKLTLFGTPYLLGIARHTYITAPNVPVLELVQLEERDGQLCPVESFGVASINPPAPLKPGEVAIKNWSENEGVLEGLLEAGIVQRPHRQIPSGFVQIPVCMLNEEKLSEYLVSPS